MNRSRAIVLEGPRRHRLATGPVPEPGHGEVRIRVAAAGLCGSDGELYRGGRPAAFGRYPVTPGHEWSGTVEAVGPGADPALVGRAVVGEGFRACRRCERCRAGDTTLCGAGYAETGFTEPGAFADHLVLPEHLLHLLAPGADLRAAALLEPAAVVAAAQLAGAPQPGERVAVVGGGTIGLLTAQFLAAISPAEITVVDPRADRADRAELAHRSGATAVLTPEKAEAEAGRYDLVVETAGAPATARAATRLARRGGRIVLTGIPESAHGLDPVDLVVRRLTLHTVFGAPSAAWSLAVRTFDAGLLDTAALITHELPLEEYATAVALLDGRDPGVGKVLLRP
jgi:2-desacetyl-2-hydroxyethyl bacteriochlorophyllide A dehydrogenase